MKKIQRIAALAFVGLSVLGPIAAVGAPDPIVYRKNQDCRMLPGDAAIYGYQNNSGHRLSLRAGGNDEQFINTSFASLSAGRGTSYAYVAAGSYSLNKAETHGYCHPWD